MKRNLFLFPIGIGSVILFSGCSFSEIPKSNDIAQPPESERDFCIVHPIKKRVSGNSMEPMIRNGDTVSLFPNYYKNCEIRPQKGDLVAYDFSGRNIPLIKKVVATPSDRVQIVQGTLIVNGKEVKNSGGVSYVFSSAEIRMLAMGIKDDHTLPSGSLLLLGDNVKNSQDSRKFGVVHESDLLGKFDF